MPSFTEKLKKAWYETEAMFPNNNPGGHLGAQLSQAAPQLDGLCRLATTIGAPTNAQAVSMLKSALQQPGNKASNPIFLMGPPGSGKSHLLKVIVHELPNLKSVIFTGSQLVQMHMQAVQSGTVKDFKKRYSGVDLFILDDLEEIGGQHELQSSLVEIIGKLVKKGAQVAYASNQNPQMIPGMLPDLSQLLTSGAGARLQQPDLSTRDHILRQIASHLKFLISTDVTRLIAQQSASISENALKLLEFQNFIRARGMEPSAKTARGYFGIERTIEGGRSPTRGDVPPPPPPPKTSPPPPPPPGPPALPPPPNQPTPPPQAPPPPQSHRPTVDVPPPPAVRLPTADAPTPPAGRLPTTDALIRLPTADIPIHPIPTIDPPTAIPPPPEITPSSPSHEGTKGKGDKYEMSEDDFMAKFNKALKAPTIIAEGQDDEDPMMAKMKKTMK